MGMASEFDSEATRMATRGWDSVQIRLFSTLGIIALIWGLSLFGLSLMRQEIQAAAMREQFALTQQLAVQLDNNLKNRLDDLLGVAALLDRNRLDDADYVREFLKSRYVFQKGFSGGTAVVSGSGYTTADYPPGPGRQGMFVADREYYRQPLATKRPYIGKPIMGRSLQRPTLHMSVPVLDRNGTVKAVLVGITDLTTPGFLGMLDDTGRLGGAEVYLMSPQDNLIIVAPQRQRTLTPLPPQGTSEIGDKIRAGFEGSAIAMSSQRVEKLFSVTRIPSSGWVLELAKPTVTAFQAMTRMKYATMLTGIVVTLLALVFVQYLWARFFVPLRNATSRLDVMTREPDLLQRLPEAGGEEVCSLFASFNRLIARYQAQQEELDKHRAQLEELVSERTVELVTAKREVDQLNDELVVRAKAAEAAQDQLAVLASERASHLRLLLNELTLAEQRERDLLYELLHDHVQPLLVAARLGLSGLNERTSQEDLLSAAARASRQITKVIDTARSLSVELNPPLIREKGLIPALDALCRWVHSNHGLKVDMACAPDTEPHSMTIRYILFKAIRELLMNVVKYAETKQVVLDLEQESTNMIRITVRDSGVGFDPGAARDGSGLSNMERRLDMAGGSVTINSTPGGGTSVTLVAPMDVRDVGREEESFAQTAHSHVSGAHDLSARRMSHRPRE